MRIAVFDYKVIPSNPSGGCHWRIVRDLANEHDFTVFAVEFQNPRPDRIEWVRIPALSKPLALLFISFHILAPLVYWLHKRRRSAPFDIVQFVESNLTFGDVSYAHFCHNLFLRSYWPSCRPTGLRRIARWLDYALHAWLERLVYTRVKRIVTPSAGLAKELNCEYRLQPGALQVISNPIDIQELKPADDFDRDGLRGQNGFEAEDLVIVFVALGHFERKGLPLILSALERVPDSRLKLLIVGGESNQVRPYQKLARLHGLEQRVRCVGRQADVRPFLWISDVFILPSSYETFSLVSFEAAAAGLPLLVSKLNGVEELLQEGDNGFTVEREVDSIARVLGRVLVMPPAERRHMGERARRSVAPYATSHFIAEWRKVYASLG